MHVTDNSPPQTIAAIDWGTNTTNPHKIEMFLHYTSNLDRCPIITASSTNPFKF